MHDDTLHSTADAVSAVIDASTELNRLLWCIKATFLSIDLKEPNHTLHSFRTTFYLAYSTWDGRVLFVDEWCIDPMINQEGDVQGQLLPSSPDKASLTMAQSMMRPILASIALNLFCTRLVWHHNSLQQNSELFPIIPQFLKEWVTLMWSQESFCQYAAITPTASNFSSSSIAFLSSIERNILVRRHLIELFSSKSMLRKYAPLQVRMADITPSENSLDVQALVRLVQGLAVYEKEADAVHVSSSHYIVDQGQFLCFLLEDTDPSSTTATSSYICGMAVCYIGQRYVDQNSPFLYLEDLFIEPAYRGKGGGQLMMQTIAHIGALLQCAFIKWQALDWNTPALQFYERIGAVTQHGLLTSRYAGVETLRKVSEVNLLGTEVHMHFATTSS
jgi:GNAT superfamily N-acetyltransferase